jgi:hypothetical protein
MAVADLVSIESIKIIHARTQTEWVVVENQQSNGFFEQIGFDESMFGSIPSGKLILRDPGDMIADFNFTGKDKIEIRIIDRVGTVIQLDDYYIYQASRITDYADRTQPRMTILKFIHESYFLNERKPFEFVEAIKKICSTTEDSGGGIPGRGDLFDPGLGSAEGDPILIASTSFGGDSWIKDIFFEYFPNDSYNVDATENYAWLKNKPIIFPSGRKVDHSKILPLLNYLAEFSNSKSAGSDRARSDFFFWKDLSSANFKSLKKLTETEPRATFMVMARDSYNNAEVEDRIEKIDSIKVHPILSLMELENSGAFCSFYERLEPDFSNPYFDYTDNGIAIKKSNVVYRIHEHFPETNYNFYEVATEATDFTNTDEIIKNDDSLVEYFNTQKGITLTVYSKRVFDEGKYGYFDSAYNNSFLHEHSYGFHTEYGVTNDELSGDRNTQLMWQTMFDIEEFNPIVPGTDKNIAKIYIDLKKNLRTKKETYLRLIRLKEKWNIFKYVVCCLNDGNDTFLAMITGFEEITQGNYTKVDAYKYSWKEVKVVPSSLSNGSGAATTLDFELQAGDQLYNSNHPYFKILVPARGRTGDFDTKFEAYNINEMTNFEGTLNSESVKISSPSTNLNVSGYPEGFRTIPIGAYPTTADPCDTQIHAAIVTMHQINLHTIPGLTFTNQEYKNTPFIYMFKEINAVEGKCEACQ